MAFAQFERDLIVTRTQEGKAYAREHDPNFKEGRPKKFTDEQIEIARQLREKGYTRKMIEKATGISVATQKRRIKQLETKKASKQELLMQMSHFLLQNLAIDHCFFKIRSNYD